MNDNVSTHMSGTADAPTTCRIAMLLLPGFNAFAAQAFVDPFRAANYLRGSPVYAWPFVTVDGEAAVASNGLAAVGNLSIVEADGPFDFVVVNASWSPERFRQKALQTWLRRQARSGAVLCALDTGAFVLAFAGLMSGYRASLHYEHAASYRELFPSSPMEETLFVFDRDRLTCCGGAASADMALEIVRMQHGIDLANAAARYIFHERLRPGEDGQLPSNYEPVGYAAPDRLRDAIVIMERNLEHALSLPEIAGDLGISQRQLERLFRRHTGVTPARYYRDVRLDRARSLVTQTEMPIVDVAAACGFGAAAQFTRAYRARFGLAPSRDRTLGRVPFQFRSFPSHAGV